MYSDTTATTLTSLFFYLAQKPEHVSLLREELASHVAGNKGMPHQGLQYLEHLSAVINETLRLHPPVGTALQRLTPPEGLYIEDTYIPGRTTVWCPQFVIGRSKCHNLLVIVARSSNQTYGRRKRV